MPALRDRFDPSRTGRYKPPEAITEVPCAEAFWPPLDEAAVLRAPPVLFAAGDVSLLQARARVSIVGARKASESGLRRAARLARLLGQAGVVVVSGLARGVDRAAHTACIDAGGRTIAVIGTPIDHCYPAEHARLQEMLCREHLVVSQFASGSRISRASFPARNRTMAMLSHASVIVEAGDSSGSLSQAAETQRLGRLLFIMRNVVDNDKLKWPPSFLAHGAIVLDDVHQILDALPAVVNSTTALRAYSHYPYAPKDDREVYKRDVSFLRAFKNGRRYGYRDERLDFDGVVRKIAETARLCPAFSEPCFVVPVPRSGSSRESFQPDACEYPCAALAKALAATLSNVRVAELLSRVQPVTRASDTPGRVTIAQHLESLAVEMPAELAQAKLVLVDDIVTKGTQLAACVRALRQAGHKGPIEAFCVSQTVAPNPTGEQQLPFLRHHISWREGDDHARRVERGQWRPSTG